MTRIEYKEARTVAEKQIAEDDFIYVEDWD